MEEECLICRQPLEYLEEDVLMECAVCHKKESSKTRCIQGIMCAVSVILRGWTV